MHLLVSIGLFRWLGRKMTEQEFEDGRIHVTTPKYYCESGMLACLFERNWVHLNSWGWTSHYIAIYNNDEDGVQYLGLSSRMREVVCTTPLASFIFENGFQLLDRPSFREKSPLQQRTCSINELLFVTGTKRFQLTTFGCASYLEDWKGDKGWVRSLLDNTFPLALSLTLLRMRAITSGELQEKHTVDFSLFAPAFSPRPTLSH